MNVKQAKQLDFRLLLHKMGYQPERQGIKKGGRELWYKSPLTPEKNASFHITQGQQVAWIFKCFSSGKGGTILDFVIAHQGYASDDIKSALAFLRQQFSGTILEKRAVQSKSICNHFSFHQQRCVELTEQPNATPDRDLIYLEDLPLKSGQILSYLEEGRCIPSSLAQKYLRLVRYKNTKLNKTFYAFGMKNRAGGFEIRAASDTYRFKSALIARDISVIQGTDDPRHLLVFEGMTDFLAFLALQKLDTPLGDALILHSVNSYKKAVAFLKNRKYQRIHTFLDNDEAGQNCTRRFAAKFANQTVSHSASFLPHKDVNDALIAGQVVDFAYSKKVARSSFTEIFQAG